MGRRRSSPLPEGPAPDESHRAVFDLVGDRESPALLPGVEVDRQNEPSLLVLLHSHPDHSGDLHQLVGVPALDPLRFLLRHLIQTTNSTPRALSTPAR